MPRLLCLIWLSFFHSQIWAEPFSGLPTHDQNPLLTPYWIPHTLQQHNDQGLKASTALFITNTLHIKNNAQESLIIDSESYHLDINLQYQFEHWLLSAQIPLIASSRGFLDSTIIDWHDFFQLPQGDRLSQANNQHHYHYQVNGETIVNQQDTFSGIGDISLALSQPIKELNNGQWIINFGINLPSESGDNSLISNGRLDSAIWLSYHSHKQPTLNYYITLGNSQIGDGGPLKGLVKNSIWFAQGGLAYRFSKQYQALFQLDYHQSLLKQTNTDVLGDSLQMQLGLKINDVWEANQLTLFFSEDISVGSAPDISLSALLQFGF